MIEHELFLSFLAPVKKNLYNFVRKSLNFSPEADDIFQETVLKGFRYFYSYDRSRNFKTWIFTIAHNLMNDSFAFRRKNFAVSLEEIADIPIETRSISDDVREVYIAAGQLASRNREVFFLYYNNEFSVSEISEITGLSRANVKFKLSQARAQIRKKMEVFK